MNKVVLIGNLTKDPDIRITPGKGTAVTNITLAVTTGFGENKQTAFIPIVIWGKTAEAVANYTKKGSKVAISGKIQTRSYEKDGRKIYITEVVADMYEGVQFLDSKNNSNSNNQQSGYQQNSFDDGMEEVYDDGDVPF